MHHHDEIRAGQPGLATEVGKEEVAVESIMPLPSPTYDHHNEKKDDAVIEVNSLDGSSDEEVDDFVKDPFVPFTNMPEERSDIVTIRALVIGCMCGVLVNASNLYLGLKTSWTFSANIFGSILSFAILKFFSTACAGFPILGGSFGPKENGIAMTAATAAGGMSNVFISAFPAMYQLELWKTPSQDFGRIIALTAVGAYFGLCFAAPLRKFFIIHVARELRLTFPSSSATAVTIRSMHAALASGSGAAAARKKTWALLAAFGGAIALRVGSVYATGILWDWHFFTWFYIWKNFQGTGLLVAEAWGWYVEFTPAFIGAGFLVGLNVAFSFYGGSVLAWGIIGPSLIKNKLAFAQFPYTNATQLGQDFVDKWEDLPVYFSLNSVASTVDTPSPRYWMLWPGVLTMIVVSFVELGCQYKVIGLACRAIYRGTRRSVASIRARYGHGSGPSAHEQEVVDTLDPQLPGDRIKTWMWAPGLFVIIILTCVVTGVGFDMPVGESLLAIFLSFFFSLLAIQCSGATDITPLTAAGKATQLILGGATRGEHWQVTQAQRLNLLGGAVTNIGANQSADLVGDFRTGFLLGTPAKKQYLAQLIGTICAIFVAPGMFVLFAKAYPCILNLNELDNCAFAVPNAAGWRAVTVAITSPQFPVPKSSGIFSICFALLGAVMVLIRHFVLKGKYEWVRTYWPNMMVMALAFVIPQSVYGFADVIGAVIAFAWARKSPKSWEMYGYAVAAGLIAGEGIGGVVNAVLQIAGIGGDTYGVQIACPADSC